MKCKGMDQRSCQTPAYITHPAAQKLSHPRRAQVAEGWIPFVQR